MDNEGNRRELYRIPENPAESRNLIEKHPEIAEELRQKIMTWSDTLPQSPPGHCFSELR
jgi:hypothetical protein